MHTICKNSFQKRKFDHWRIFWILELYFFVNSSRTSASCNPSGRFPDRNKSSNTSSETWNNRKKKSLIMEKVKIILKLKSRLKIKMCILWRLGQGNHENFRFWKFVPTSPREIMCIKSSCIPRSASGSTAFPRPNPPPIMLEKNSMKIFMKNDILVTILMVLIWFFFLKKYGQLMNL